MFLTAATMDSSHSAKLRRKLLSFVNMKLRDQYASLDDLCDDLNVLSVELEEKLGEIGYFYNAKENRFV